MTAHSSTPQTPANSTSNPILGLQYQTNLQDLGEDYFDIVAAGTFPQHLLRFRNNGVLAQLGLNPSHVTDQHFIEAFGHFQDRSPLLALRYHGYQFGEYNPRLGDGRGFLYGQLRGVNGELYDLGTKGSGTTPYSRGGDGRLTLKGGVREVLASEALHHLGVRTSRCLSLIETGEELWRGDEPSPTRSSVMVRFSRSHIRFGTFERLHALGRPDLIRTLLDHVIETYYPHLVGDPDQDAKFYAELVQRTAELVAQWMSVGFCHAVLNTDNMSITGESFDYGPYAFISTYDLRFTAAYFDYYGRYAYGNQPTICHWNLEMLQRPLLSILSQEQLNAGLTLFQSAYDRAYRQRMMQKLGFQNSSLSETSAADDLLGATIALLQTTQVGYHDFFAALRQDFSELWRVDSVHILQEPVIFSQAKANQAEQTLLLEQWRQQYHRVLVQLPPSELPQIAACLQRYNPLTVLLRPAIEAAWEPIAQTDDWEPFYKLLKQVSS
ncbi:MAG: YdiU family protein [Thermosynechococcaceae cyanobacterium MS004]|nr:YdiU family protein [Thermosynechococcaceae cyanobacterium MS004]